MQKAKQLETFLAGIFCVLKNGTEQAVDTFCQHATSPRMAQDFVYSFLSLPKLLCAQQRNGLIQVLFPKISPG
jgi:hypothetical protein